MASTVNAETRLAYLKQRNAVLRCECGGTIREDGAPRGLRIAGKCDRCGETGRYDAESCFECDALFWWFDGPPVPTECPDCAKGGSDA